MTLEDERERQRQNIANQAFADGQNIARQCIGAAVVGAFDTKQMREALDNTFDPKIVNNIITGNSVAKIKAALEQRIKDIQRIHENRVVQLGAEINAYQNILDFIEKLVNEEIK